jgi:hypothetical protein
MNKQDKQDNIYYRDGQFYCLLDYFGSLIIM